MNNQMITATTTLSQLLKRVDAISENIANVNTTGYKAKQVSFQNVLHQVQQNNLDTDKEVGRQTPYGINVGLGAKVSSVNRTFMQGSLQMTNRPLDVAIIGNATYFTTANVTNNDGVTYTRDGAFILQEHPNRENEFMLSALNGHAVLDVDGNPISASGPIEHMEVNRNGKMTIIDGNGDSQTFQLGLVKMTKPDLLEQVGENHFKLSTNEEGVIQQLNLNEENQDHIAIQQGALELSNVNLTDEMTNLMTTQRMIQFQGRAISMADQMMGLANGIRG
jgi:flagellar basal-body rod protein FlgG